MAGKQAAQATVMALWSLVCSGHILLVMGLIAVR